MKTRCSKCRRWLEDKDKKCSCQCDETSPTTGQRFAASVLAQALESTTTMNAEAIYNMLSSAHFEKWYRGEFETYITGDVGAVSKDEILSQIEELIRRNTFGTKGAAKTKKIAKPVRRNSEMDLKGKSLKDPKAEQADERPVQKILKRSLPR